jgi:hypothetical protein
VTNPTARVIAPAAALLLLACGQSNPEPAAKTSVRQAASIVAKHHAKITEQIAYEATCGSGSSVVCLQPRYSFPRYQQIATTAGQLHDELAAARPVESEVRKLTEETLVATAAVVTSWDLLNRCAQASPGDVINSCGGPWQDNERAWRALPAKLDAWKPYGG